MGHILTRGETATRIAAVLNKEGWRPPRRRETFNGSMICGLLSRQGLCARRRDEPMTVELERKPDEWTLGELARKLEMPAQTLYAWRSKGRLEARAQTCNARRIWLVHADAAELDRLRSFRQTSRSAAPVRLPTRQSS